MNLTTKKSRILYVASFITAFFIFISICYKLTYIIDAGATVNIEEKILEAFLIATISCGICTLIGVYSFIFKEVVNWINKGK